MEEGKLILIRYRVCQQLLLLCFMPQHSPFFTVNSLPREATCSRQYKDVLMIVKQDATLYSLFISVNRSTCFGWYRHPSSATHNTVSALSGIAEAVTATCRECDWMGHDREQ